MCELMLTSLKIIVTKMLVKKRSKDFLLGVQIYHIFFANSAGFYIVTDFCLN